MAIVKFNYPVIILYDIILRGQILILAPLYCVSGQVVLYPINNMVEY